MGITAPSSAFLFIDEDTTPCPRYPPGDDGVAEVEQRSRMTTLRRWFARTLARPEQFPKEYRAERLDQHYPLARPAAWYEAQQEARVRHTLR